MKLASSDALVLRVPRWVERAGLALLLSAALGGCSPSPLDSSPDAGLVDGAATDLPSPSDGAVLLTTVRVHYPAGAHTLTLRGDGTPLSWSLGLPLQAGPDDTWEARLELTADPVELKPLLDDTTWSKGPNYRVHRGETVDLYPWFFADQGQVIRLHDPFHSTLLGNDRIVWAYLPAGYEENTRARYPVVYMHDGQNLFDPARAFGGNEWRVDEALDQGGIDGSIRPLIVIAPEATAGRLYEYTPSSDPVEGSSGGGALYLQMLVEELKPGVDATLRTLSDRASTGIVGSSLGGLISAWAGVDRPETFGLVGALSPSTWWDGRMIIGAVAASGAALWRPARVYLDSGDSGPSGDGMSDTNDLADAYLALGYQAGVDFLHVVQVGATHNEAYWAMRLPGALAFLFGPRSP